jgi:hypothetical protein
MKMTKNLNKVINDILKEYIKENELFNKHYDLLIEAFKDSGEHDRWVDAGVVEGSEEYKCTVAFLVGLWNVFERSGLKVEPFFKVLEDAYKEKTNRTLVGDIIRARSKKIDYNKIIEKAIVYNVPMESHKINMIIPVQGRYDHLQLFVRNFHHHLKNDNDIHLTLVFSDNDVKGFEYAASAARSNGISNITCVYFPQKDIIDLCGESLNRSLCYNLASKMFESEWLINHDIDLLLSKEYIDYVKEVSLDEDVNWVQPYYGGRVIYLTEKQTEQVTERYFKNDIVTLELDGGEPKKSYAPGGSLMVRQVDFDAIGGYDPQLVWGYAPEDALIWIKLEFLYNEDIGYGEYVHHGAATYAANKKCNLYHAYHPATVPPKENNATGILVSHWLNQRATKDDRKKYLEACRNEYEN